MLPATPTDRLGSYHERAARHLAEAGHFELPHDAHSAGALALGLIAAALAAATH